MMALVGQLIGLLVNAFWLDKTLYWVTTATGVLLFSALTAYDVQKLKRLEPPDADKAGTCSIVAVRRNVEAERPGRSSSSTTRR